MKQIFVKKKLFSLGFVLFVYTIIITPLLFINLQKQQQTQSHAEAPANKIQQSPTITIIPTPTIQLTTSFNLVVRFDGIGAKSEVAKPPNLLNNKTPLHKTLSVDTLVYTTERKLIASGTGLVSYDAKNGTYAGSVHLQGTTFMTGKYYLEIKSRNHASAFTPDQIITAGKTNIVLPITLLGGDIYTDSLINVLDYNALLNCYSEFTTKETCSATQKEASDINDDSLIEQADYALFVNQIAKQ